MNIFIDTLRSRNETLFYFGALCLALSIVFLFLTKVTTTQVLGVSAWYKPFKFALSICLFVWSMAWYCYYLPDFNIRAFNWAIIALMLFEVVHISIQAGRGQLSHYNNTTSVYSAFSVAMGIAALLATIYVGYVAILFFTNDFPELPAYYLWSIRLALLIFVIFALEGGVMGSRISHTVGAADGSNGIPILNWSKDHGDLRIAHFIGMHALQVLPILAFYCLKDVKTIIAIGFIYFLLAALVLVQALNGRSLFSWRL